MQLKVKESGTESLVREACLKATVNDIKSSSHNVRFLFFLFVFGERIMFVFDLFYFHCPFFKAIKEKGGHCTIDSSLGTSLRHKDLAIRPMDKCL
uniref:Uncharacterized protein LOC101309580 isoform X2 n=1 Tax=Rhizophora mucronata TaxID=61149 RepID=A0A2P2LTI7_RHIMU